MQNQAGRAGRLLGLGDDSQVLGTNLAEGGSHLTGNLETHCFRLMPSQPADPPTLQPGPAPPRASSPSRCSVVTRPSATMKAIF